MMESVLIKVPVVSAGVHLKPGQVYDLPRDDALILLRMGRAVPFDGEPIKPVKRKPKTMKRRRAE